LRRFNAQGRVPTNRTTLQIIRNDGEHRWQSAESIALLAAIAGLFHDFGKAGMCFQQTLKGKVSTFASRIAMSGSRFVCSRRL
jgi:CRISPR-associated endonuclease/helicase Cas3